MRFIIFLVFFLSLYSGLHLYAFIRVKHALALGRRVTATLIAYMVIMVFAPILVRTLERIEFENLARVLAYVGYTWMGLLFLFFSAAFVLDLYRLLIAIGRLILSSDLAFLKVSPRLSFFLAFFLSVFATVYGSYEAARIRAEHLTIKTHKISAEVARIRIAQISDVHLGLIVKEKRLERIIEKIKSAKPDILVSTGDLLDGQADNLTGLADMLREIPVKHGKFAITGNHEFYVGLDRSMKFLEKAGFTILRGDAVGISGVLNIAGVDDVAGKRYGLMKEMPEKTILSKLPRDQFTLFLKHRPVIDREAREFFDLQLSGHTHKGQIFPFNLITKLFYPNPVGLSRFAENAYLYLSRGTGTWGPPIRFLAPPEVAIIDLVSE